MAKIRLFLRGWSTACTGIKNSLCEVTARRCLVFGVAVAFKSMFLESDTAQHCWKPAVQSPSCKEGHEQAVLKGTPGCHLGSRCVEQLLLLMLKDLLVIGASTVMMIMNKNKEFG